MPSEIEHVIKETLEGHQREIMAHMTVEEIYRKISIFNIFGIFRNTEIVSNTLSLHQNNYRSNKMYITGNGELFQRRYLRFLRWT